jgi:hypothetical protein
MKQDGGGSLLQLLKLIVKSYSYLKTVQLYSKDWTNRTKGLIALNKEETRCLF